MTENEEPKIIADEDWKDQVQAEKEAAAAEVESRKAAEQSQEIPPASFDLLVTSLATQAVFAMGLIPDPNTGQPSVDLKLARHNIDMLGVVSEKTQGNLTAEEAELVNQSLHELRTMYVSVANASPPADDEPESPSGIVMP